MSEHLRKADWEVRPVSIDVARRLICREHYARGASNTAVYLHGLFREGEIFDEQCKGVAWWLPPTRTAAASILPFNWQGVLALSRLAIEEEVPTNGCSFLLARSVRLMDRKTWPVLVTYADEWRGHTGAIYRASGWAYLGKTRPERTYTINGRMVARKAGGRSRRHDEMLQLGAVLEGSFAKHKFALGLPAP